MNAPMRIFLATLAWAFAATAAAQSPAPTPTPAPERAPTRSLNLNLKLDDTTRRSAVSEQASEQRTSSGALPQLGGGSKRSFDTPAGSRPRSEPGAGPFPKSLDTP